MAGDYRRQWSGDYWRHWTGVAGDSGQGISESMVRDCDRQWPDDWGNSGQRVSSNNSPEKTRACALGITADSGQCIT